MAGLIGRRTEVRAYLAQWRNATILLFSRQEGAKFFVGQLEWKEHPGDYSPVPLEAETTLDTTMSQQLMDDLWQCGFRPSEGTGSAGALRATENHLTDMRKLVFSLMDRAEVGKP